MTITPYQCSVHTHTTLCDGKGTPDEMAASAYASGVKYYGFSGHSFSPNPMDFGYNLPPDTSEYRQKVLALREEYAGRMEILLGIEWDGWTEGDPEGYDYWIGSAHAIRDAEGNYYAVDNTPAMYPFTVSRTLGRNFVPYVDALVTGEYPENLLAAIDVDHGVIKNDAIRRFREARGVFCD